MNNKENLPPAPCRVKIIKCSYSQGWYANLIGEEFDTDLASPPKDYVLWEDYITNATMWRHISQEDCIRINNNKNKSIMSYTDYPSEQKAVKEQSALERIHTKLSNAVSPALSATKQIEEKLHAILNLNYPQNVTSGNEVAPDTREFKNGGAISQLEEQVLLAHEVTDRLEKILKHLNQIV